MTIAYLANSFPESVEPYIWDEIRELRRQGQNVIPCSIKRPVNAGNSEAAEQTLYVFPLRFRPYLLATWCCALNFPILKEFLVRIVAGPEPMRKRLRGVVHTWLGVYLALLLRDHNIEHIHVHHGYFASWVGMVAARILGAGFSVTLHGSDLLVRADYLDVKLKNCSFCITVSEFNRQYIFEKYPGIDPNKIFVSRIGIDVSNWRPREPAPEIQPQEFKPLILSVGRLHPVKNHVFLLQGCRVLKARGVLFRCAIAGEGRERASVERFISARCLDADVALLGEVRREDLSALYSQAQAVVLTSVSEGIPVTLMEAMAMEKLVLAPAITGIPELISHGETGFLYQPGSIDDFLNKLQTILAAGSFLAHIGQAARKKIERDFNSAVNLRAFAETFIERMSARFVPRSNLAPSEANENPVLQQI